MSEVIQETQREFWQPPSPVVAEEMVVREAIPTMAETCARCGSEFLLGSRFCHTCGGRRPEAISHAARSNAAAMAGLWDQGVSRLRSMVAEFSWDKISLPVGLITAKTFVDWQAIQFYRAEWLLAATASFVAGILLKKPSGN